MDNDQIGLSLEDELKSLLIVKDGRVVELCIDEIFDAEKYDEIYAITYVSSPSFFSKYTEKFERIDFIMGIDDNRSLEKFASGINLKTFIDTEERIKFFSELETEAKYKLVDGRLTIRFSEIDTIIHDKIYLLKNSVTGENRVIIGSANFTRNAFSDNKQYENIRIDDNNELLFDIYFKRFKELTEKTIDYIPERCIKEYKEEARVLSTSGEIAEEVLIDEIIKHNKKVIISEKAVEAIKERSANIQFEKEEIDKTKDILSLIT